MAACLITTGGTSGTLRIDYKLGSDSNTIFSNYGDIIYIDDSATDITYTRLSGDVTAASGCVTITARPQTCYKFIYDTVDGTSLPTDSTIDAIVVGTTYTFTEASYRLSGTEAIIYGINTELNNDNIKVTAIKVDQLTEPYFNVSLIVKIIGTDIPRLRIVTTNGNYVYLIGTVSVDCVPSGYIDLNTSSIPVL